MMECSGGRAFVQLMYEKCKIRNKNGYNIKFVSKIINNEIKYNFF